MVNLIGSKMFLFINSTLFPPFKKKLIKKKVVQNYVLNISYSITVWTETSKHTKLSHF